MASEGRDPAGRADLHLAAGDARERRGLSAPRVGVRLERARVFRFSARSAFFLSTTFSILLRRRLLFVVVVQRLLRLLLLLRVARAEGRRGCVRRAAPLVLLGEHERD